MTNTQIEALLSETAAANPCLLVSAPPMRRLGAPSGNGGHADVADCAVSGEASLYAHVAGWIDANIPDNRSRQIAARFLDALDLTGWLLEDVSRIAARSGGTMAEAEAVLARLHRIDPPGLFARSLSECLRLQARDAGLLDEVMAGVLDRLETVAAGDAGLVAAQIGTTTPEVLRRVDLIRSFDPKPGLRFADLGPIAAPADLIATGGRGALRVALHPASMVAAGTTEDPADTYADVALPAQARQAVAMVARRNQSLLRVAEVIATRQADAMHDGPRALLPLTREEVAAATSLHQSTVSRLTAETTIDTPAGVRPLARFFSSRAAGDVSSVAARERLRRLIDQEDSRAPLSDARLADLLQAEGLPLARRTVAKYREALNLPPAFRRRRQP